MGLRIVFIIKFNSPPGQPSCAVNDAALAPPAAEAAAKATLFNPLTMLKAMLGALHYTHSLPAVFNVAIFVMMLTQASTQPMILDVRVCMLCFNLPTFCNVCSWFAGLINVPKRMIRMMMVLGCCLSSQ